MEEERRRDGKRKGGGGGGRGGGPPTMLSGQKVANSRQWRVPHEFSGFTTRRCITL